MLCVLYSKILLKWRYIMGLFDWILGGADAYSKYQSGDIVGLLSAVKGMWNDYQHG